MNITSEAMAIGNAAKRAGGTGRGSCGSRPEEKASRQPHLTGAVGRELQPRLCSRRALLITGGVPLLLLFGLCAADAQAQGAGSVRGGAAGAAAEPMRLEELNTGRSEMRGALERYADDLGSLRRSYPIEISPARRARFKQFYTEWREWLAAQNFDALGAEGRADYLLFRNLLDYELRQSEADVKELAEIAPLVPFAQTIIELEESRRRMEPVNASKAAAVLTDLKKRIEETRLGVAAGVEPERRAEPAREAARERPAEKKPEPIRAAKHVANRAAGAVNSLRATLKNWFDFFHGYDPVFTWWAGEPYKQADKALEDYGKLLRERVVGLRPDDRETIIGNPVGREALLSELQREMIPYTPEELMAIGRKDLEWCQAEMKKAAREMGYGDDWRKALEHVKTLHVEPGRQPELIRQLAVEAVEFMDQHDLVTVPALAREVWRMEMMSPERQLINPFFTGGEVIRVSFPTNTMGHEQKLMSLRGNNIHFARATVHHELIPGHHLQGFMTARYRDYRGIFSTAFWGEGWALYWELLLWDMNFQKSPENKIGMLFWRSHRGARIVFSLGFHLGQMTAEECVNFLVNEVGHERENAAAEVRRSFSGGPGPLYQAAYLLGGLQFYALHKELVGSGRMTNREFHDAILKENRIPVEMVRAILSGQTLTRDLKSNWKFYGPNLGR